MRGSSFTASARQFAQGNGIELVDGTDLATMSLELFPESAEDSFHYAACKRCGAVVPYRDLKRAMETCPKGHSVSNPVNLDLPPHMTFPLLLLQS